MALNIKVGPIGLLDMLKFKNQAKTRRKVIQNAPNTPLAKTFGSNEQGRLLHPDRQEMVVKAIITHSPDVRSYVLAKKDGTPAAWFRAGQYVSVRLSIGGSLVTRPYSISSGPDLSLKGEYCITVKRADGGFASPHILTNWAVGTLVTLSGPLGDFYYEPLRDASRVVALAGGSGITPFLSMAYAIRDGREAFDLTVLYGSRTKADALFQKEFLEISAACSKVRLVNVLSDEEAEGCEHGFLTAALIEKYLTDGDTSLFLCGPEAMYRFLDVELPKLGLANKFIRRELMGATKTPYALPGYPAQMKDRVFTLTLSQCGQTHTLPCNANEPVLAAIERAGICAPSHCRSGICGYCHSKLLAGNVFIPEDTDGRRAADLVYGYIHPCASYALSDLSLEIPGAY